jgi:protein subunit release factor A
MVENNQSHALKVLKTKLKELQNENNWYTNGSSNKRSVSSS